MKQTWIFASIMMLTLLLALPLAAQGSHDGSGGTLAASGGKALVDTDKDGIPDQAEKLLGTNPYAADTDGDGLSDKDDKEPLSVRNPITDTGAMKLPVKVLDARTEDNYKADDHLEITLQNTGSAALDAMDVFFTITDKVNSRKESYYVKLSGFVIPAGEKKTLHFDNKTGDGHFPGNVNGLYGTSANGLDFDVLLHAEGKGAIRIHVEKSPGTAEVAD